MALLVLPVLPIAWRQIPGYNNPNLVLPHISDYLGQLARAFTLGELSPASIWAWGRWLWLALLLGGLAGWLSRRRWQQMQGARLSLLASWLLGSLAVFYLILVSRSAFNARYISFILPALWALTGWALSGWRRWGRLLPAGAALTLALLSLPALRADLYDPTHFREDMSSVVAYLQEHSTSKDVILVDQRYPFGFYWQRWNNDFYGQPPRQPANMAPAQYLFVDLTHNDERRLDARLNRLAGEARRVFYVTWFESDMDPRGAVPALLNAAGSIIDEVNFRGYTVRTWDLHPPTRFALPSAMMPIGRQFDQGVTLVSGDWSGRQQPAPPGRPLIITLRWQLQAASDRVLKVSLRLQDSEGATLAQDDRLLLNDRHVRSNAWLPGENALNIYQVPAPAEAGDYRLTVVVYDADTLAPLSLADGSGVEAVFGQARVAP